jgi:hypothetical protein
MAEQDASGEANCDLKQLGSASDGNGVLYRSADGGKPWRAVFTAIGGTPWNSCPM